MAIKKLTLINFRNHDNLVLGDGKSPVNFLIVGNNGVGKTNVLEAISFFSPGKGMRKALPYDVLNQKIIAANSADIAVKEDSEDRAAESAIRGKSGWTAKLELSSYDEQRAVFDQKLQLSYVFSANDYNLRPEKILKMDEDKIRSNTNLIEALRVVWFMPQMCNLFIEGAQVRRNFFDRIILNFVPSHAQNLTDYKKLVSARLRLLREGNYDPVWLEKLEMQIAEKAINIANNRHDIVAKLNADLRKQSWNFVPEIILESGVRSAMQGEETSDISLITEYKEKLYAGRQRDARANKTLFGCHLDDFKVRHSQKKVWAINCSTGEHKNFILKIIFAAIRVLKQELKDGVPIILLLDDIFAHIDNENKILLQSMLLELKNVQKWITGTPTDMDFLLAADEKYQIVNL